jgi:hypothetical protein
MRRLHSARGQGQGRRHARGVDEPEWVRQEGQDGCSGTGHWGRQYFVHRLQKRDVVRFAATVSLLALLLALVLFFVAAERKGRERVVRCVQLVAAPTGLPRPQSSALPR